MQIEKKSERLERYLRFLNPGYTGFIVIVVVVKEKAHVKVYHEQTDRQTDGWTDRRWRVSK